MIGKNLVVVGGVWIQADGVPGVAVINMTTRVSVEVSLDTVSSMSLVLLAVGLFFFVVHLIIEIKDVFCSKIYYIISCQFTMHSPFSPPSHLSPGPSCCIHSAQSCWTQMELR